MLSEPESYGLSAEATLSHTCTTVRPPDFDAFWQAACEEVATLPVGAIDLSDEGPFRFQSVRDVMIHGRVIPHSGDALRGAVLELHGAETSPQISGDPPEWADAGLATVRIHVRGFPPSDAGYAVTGARWLCSNAGLAEAWIVRHAAVDVVQAFRLVRRALEDRLPVSFVGPSLGGGLAVIAAAMLSRMGDAPAGLVLDLPSLGDWSWRVDRYCNGLGGPLNQLIDALRGDDRDAMVASLAYCDAALHAPLVGCPVLCRLAELDDVVPAPTAAAICNALGSTEVERFITRYGHYDGGISHARQVMTFRKLVPRFLLAGNQPAPQD